MVDTTDIKILNVLLENSRMSTTKIAEHVDVSNVATQQRMTKMEKAGIIQGYTAIVDYRALGYRTVAYIGLFLEKAKHYPDVITKLNEVPQVLEAHFTTGNYSIFAKIIAKDNVHLMEILNDQIQNIEGVARTETFISLQEGIHKSMFL